MKHTYLLIAALPSSPPTERIPEVTTEKNLTPTVQAKYIALLDGKFAEWAKIASPVTKTHARAITPLCRLRT